VKITDEAILAAVKYSIRYMMNKHLPDKAIDLIDEACARMSTLHAKLENNNDYTEIENDIDVIHKKIEQVIKDQDYFKAAELKQEEEVLKKKLTEVRQQNTLPKHLRPTIGEEHVGQVLADKL
jgi:ATP-dependent Clp protease ATP-binding subunit ClpC